MVDELIPYAKHHISDDDISAVVRILHQPLLTQGEEVATFEKQFIDYTGAKYAFAVSSGTTALHLAVAALGVSSGDVVIVSTLTFVATANAVINAGGTVLLADVDENLVLDVTVAARLLEANPKVKGIIATSFAGHPIAGQRLRELADRHGVWLIEDAAHALGARSYAPDGSYYNVGEGHFADVTAFSFHPAKHITAGEGGAVTSNRDDLADALRILRSHCIRRDRDTQTVYGGWYYEIDSPGHNYRMSDINAALVSSQFKRIEQNIETRNLLARRYNGLLKDMQVVLPPTAEYIRHAYHLYPIQVDSRREVFEALQNLGIRCQVHYIPLHRLTLFRRLGWTDADFPNAEKYYSGCLSLPMYPELTYEQQDRVVACLREVLV